MVIACVSRRLETDSLLAICVKFVPTPRFVLRYYDLQGGMERDDGLTLVKQVNVTLM